MQAPEQQSEPVLQESSALWQVPVVFEPPDEQAASRVAPAATSARIRRMLSPPASGRREVVAGRVHAQ